MDFFGGGPTAFHTALTDKEFAPLIKNLNADEMWFYRKIQKISYMAKKTNKQVLIQVNQNRSLLKT